MDGWVGDCFVLSGCCGVRACVCVCVCFYSAGRPPVNAVVFFFLCCASCFGGIYIALCIIPCVERATAPCFVVVVWGGVRVLTGVL